MFNINKPSKLERKRAFHSEAPGAKHEYRLRHYGPLRFAGAVWTETHAEKMRKAARTRAQHAQTELGRSLGFADNDRFEPSNTYERQRSLRRTPDPEGYTIL